MYFKKFVILLLPLLLLLSLVPSSFGHGVGGETLLPINIGDRNVTIFVSIEPFIYDPAIDEQRFSIKFFDADTLAIIENVHYKVKISNQDDVFEDTFFDELGYLIINFKKSNSNLVSIDAIKEPTTNAWINDSNKSLMITSSLFNRGGLYDVDVEILGYDTSDNLLDEPLIFNAAVSVASKTIHRVDSNQNLYDLGITSFFDSFDDFAYDSIKKEISFSMPFTWNEQYIKQIEIIHEEFHIPKNFAELMVTKYDVTINDISLPSGSIVVDDYSQKDRIVHAILHPPFLQSIKDRASQVSDSKIYFTFKPSEQIESSLASIVESLDNPVFPIRLSSEILDTNGKTLDGNYFVDITWFSNPLEIDEESEFIITIYDKITQYPIPQAEYDFVILSETGTELYRISGLAKGVGVLRIFNFLTLI